MHSRLYQTVLRLSICPPVPLAAARHCCGFATVGPDIDQSLHSWHAAAATACGGWMRAVPRCQLMYEAEHTRDMFIFQFGTENVSKMI